MALISVRARGEALRGGVKNMNEKEKIKKLKEEVNKGDNEVVHGIYDELIEDRLRELDPRFLNKIQKIVKDINFWYA